MTYQKYLFLFLLLNAFKMLQAQVPVREEPRHKTVLENSYVRLLDVHLSPGDTTQYHIHATPSVIVFLTKSVIGTQEKSGKGLPSGPVKPAQTLFIDYAANPVTHRVYNDSTNMFHVMDIELLKQSPASDSCALMQQTGIETTINEKLVNVYKLQLQPNQSVSIPKANCAYLLICISGKVQATKKLEGGGFVFLKSGNEIPLINKQSSNAICILLALK